MIIDNEHKLIRAFGRFLKTFRNTLKQFILYTAIVTLTMLAFNNTRAPAEARTRDLGTAPNGSALPLSYRPFKIK